MVGITVTLERVVDADQFDLILSAFFLTSAKYKYEMSFKGAASWAITPILLFLGLLPSHIPPVEFSAEDYSTSHDAVGLTPPLPSTLSDTWYKWYGTIEPDENEVAKVKKTYAAYLKWQLSFFYMVMMQY